MNTITATTHLHTFRSLTPETILSLVEEAMGFYLNNICRPLNSYINRVYEIEDEDGQGFVVKFYRPGRWSLDAIEDEHNFVLELAADEIPVVAPLTLQSGQTVGHFDNICFAVFPRKGGRYVDEFSDEQWLSLGLLLGRAHAVGAAKQPVARPMMRPDRTTASQVDFLLTSQLIPADLVSRYQEVTSALIDEITPLFQDTEYIRIHGDCHAGNLIYRPDESFYLIDLDDMVVGPPVQDFWMLLPDTLEHCGADVEAFLEGYETFRLFDRSSLRLIEPLRAMRFIHYSAWCGYQVVGDGETRVIADFGTRSYWQTEIADLVDQLERIRDEEGQSYSGGNR